jgi:hypothetical protein
MHKVIAACAMILVFAGQASAGIIFYNTQATFDAATGLAGLTLLGMEDFESSTLAPGAIQDFDDPLAPGVANGPFPTGTNPATRMTVQSNTSPDGFTVAPRGVTGLVTAAVGFEGAPDDQIGNNQEPDSLDLIFASLAAAPITAVDLVPMFVDSLVTAALGDIQVQVFDIANTLLGSVLVTDITYANKLGYLGIIATAGDAVSRINLVDVEFNSVTQHYAAVDDIRVYADLGTGPGPDVPTPGTLALIGLGLASLGCSRRRKA